MWLLLLLLSLERINCRHYKLFFASSKPLLCRFKILSKVYLMIANFKKYMTTTIYNHCQHPTTTTMMAALNWLQISKLMINQINHTQRNGDKPNYWIPENKEFRKQTQHLCRIAASVFLHFFDTFLGFANNNNEGTVSIR